MKKTGYELNVLKEAAGVLASLLQEEIQFWGADDPQLTADNRTLHRLKALIVQMSINGEGGNHE